MEGFDGCLQYFVKLIVVSLGFIVHKLVIQVSKSLKILFDFVEPGNVLNLLGAHQALNEFEGVEELLEPLLVAWESTLVSCSKNEINCLDCLGVDFLGIVCLSLYRIYKSIPYKKEFLVFVRCSFASRASHEGMLPSTCKPLPNYNTVTA